MKGKLLIVVALASALSLFTVLVVAQVQQAQPPRPGKEVLRKSPTPPPPEERVKQMLDRIMSRMKLNEEQKKAVEKVVMAKIEARRKSQESLKELRKLARNRNASEDEIKAALDKFRKDLMQSKAKIQKLEEAALKIVPIRAQLMFTLTGIFDNGQPFPPQPRGELRRTRPQGRQRPSRMR